MDPEKQPSPEPDLNTAGQTPFMKMSLPEPSRARGFSPGLRMARLQSETGVQPAFRARRLDIAP